MAFQDSGSFSLLLGNVPPQKIVNTKLTWIESLQPHAKMAHGSSSIDPLYVQYTLKAFKTIPRLGSILSIYITPPETATQSTLLKSIWLLTLLTFTLQHIASLLTKVNLQPQVVLKIRWNKESCC